MVGGSDAKTAVARLAAGQQQIAVGDRPAFLDRLGSAEIRLGQVNLARQHWRELAALQPDNLAVRSGLFDLAVQARDQSDATTLIDEIRKVEGDEGVTWRYARAALLLDAVRRGASQHLDHARKVASEIAERRPRWSSGVVLLGELAELGAAPDQAIVHYLRAVQLGNVQPSVVRRLVGLLNERGRFDEIDHVTSVIGDQGAALDQITIVKALDAIRKQDFDRGLSLAREVFPDTSTSASDHLTLGRLYMTAGRSAEAGKEFRRAVELGPGVPECWLTYIRFLTQANRMDDARLAVASARKALPADRSTLTLAQCSLVPR